jgi:hypothetical protein
MRRRSTIFSLPSILIFSLLLAGLVLTIWRQGGRAFSPGDLSGTGDPGLSLEGYVSHVDFEEQCSLCHRPLTSLQADLCTACHTSIGKQIKDRSSLHGKIEEVMQCFECHSDHQGREHDLRLGSLGGFDHSLVNFSLIWHQVDYESIAIICTGCHVSDNQFSVENTACANCHAGADHEFVEQHTIDFGHTCIDCHDGLDSMARFDHANSGFHLEGIHMELECVQCHVQGQFDSLSGDCAACHAEPAEHIGMFDADCTACHTAAAWSPAWINGVEFNHKNDTSFNLNLHRVDFDGSTISCLGCHDGGGYEISGQSCFDCHAPDNQPFMSQHQLELGGDCLECHDGVDRMRTFDHQAVFQLDGGHIGVECQTCHSSQRYKDTPSECKDCHAEPEIHLGYFGLQCEYCHDSNGWSPAQLVQHTFPIDHGEEGELACETCHSSTYAEYTCFSCHEHTPAEIDDKHKDLNLAPLELSNCTECHLDGSVHEFPENEE